MKILMLSAMLAVAGVAPTVAGAQTAPAMAPAKVYNSGDTAIGKLLDDPAAKAVVEKHFPGLTTSDSIKMAAGMTLKQLQQYKPDMFTDDALKATDADLAKIPAK